jgi:hydantoinase/carbamoylase family amidase
MQRTAGPQTAAVRIVERVDELFAIGRAAGTNRPGLGAGEEEAFRLARRWMEEAGLEVHSDAAGNLYGRVAGSEPGAAEVWAGSHLDTPPDGGRFDGALGVAAAIEAIAAIARDGQPRRTLTAVAFRLEEGARFGRGVFGSRALVGMLEAGEGDLRDADGVSLADAFAAIGLGELPAGGWLAHPPACYLEAHIEQGPVLAEQGASLGVVTSIAGMAGLEIAFTGRRGHAGTVPMDLRADALAAAARAVCDAHDAARAIPGAVCTIGRLTVLPGATNTIPGRAELFADLRAPDADGLAALVSAVESAAAAAAVSARCAAQVEQRWRYEPVAMSAGPVDALRLAIERLGLPVVELPSGAGHDAAILATAGVPTAMLFVRSDAGGVSHAPEEHTGTDAVAACAAALEEALRELAGG